ncbi:30S ribosomal protein S2 [Candidatus Curtissbacteria bacterium RBG_13_40_7]|uniref:Small ribosomal subunit protein uS2 n=1 Tax=Candidatus Curtissbacteria bacterium RBG_13_40_7 TaxID=1797706 RepID=A0A1F5FUT4_9BACT|nr:MAG: 30S ribosomal protein S2 [Candidatus Curtissbacteria bacterium RBG_13_40_7]
MKIPSMQDLLEAGVHFGHQVRRWNPKMNTYIFAAREGIHVIDLEQTVKKLEEACEFVEKLAAAGGIMIFLGSKKQAGSIIEEEAERCGAKYIVERWIGGLLTNWEQAQKNIKKLSDLKTKKEEGEFSDRTKKENLLIDREINKLERFYGGVFDLDKLPDALFVVDVRKEENACREAMKKGIPVVAICDTNANTTLVDYPIPGNDDATRAIKIVTAAIADAYLSGRQKFEKKSAQEKVELAGESAGKQLTTDN